MEIRDRDIELVLKCVKEVVDTADMSYNKIVVAPSWSPNRRDATRLRALLKANETTPLDLIFGGR